MDTRKAYGVVTALGNALGEKAKAEPAVLADVRATSDLEAFRRAVAAHAAPAQLVAMFNAFVTEDDWRVWRSRLLLQAKMVREGSKPAPGHERKGP